MCFRKGYHLISQDERINYLSNHDKILICVEESGLGRFELTLSDIPFKKLKEIDQNAKKRISEYKKEGASLGFNKENESVDSKEYDKLNLNSPGKSVQSSCLCLTSHERI